MASTAVRSFDLTAYIPGQPLVVTITVTPDPATTSYMVEDTPPTGWVISAITPGVGVFDTIAGKVKWIPFDGNSPVVLTYTATPPVSESGEASFSGIGNYGQENIPIVNADGEDVHTIPEFRFHPADEHDEILVVGPDLKIQIDEAVRYWAVFFESILNPSGPFTPWPRQPEDVWNNETFAQSAVDLYKMQDGAYIFDPDVAEPFAWMTPGLSVKPSENAIVAADIVFGITGPEGGPFTPETKVYTITNTFGDPLDFNISVDVDWIDLFIDVEGTTEPPLPVTTSPAGLTGTLEPSEVRLVTAVTNDDIGLLPVGTHIGTVSFTNLTTGKGGGDRQISATIAVSLVSPFTGLDSTGFENESATLSPTEILYTLVNPTAADLDFTVSKSVNWLSFEVVFPGSTNPPVDTEGNSVGGTLAPNGDAGDTAEVTILLDAEAALLEASATGFVTHTAAISFTNNTDHSNDTVRTVNLTLSARDMRVTPLTDYDIVGSDSQEGIAFTPDSKPYLIENTTSGSIGYTVAKGAVWLDISSTGGAISPGGNVILTVSTNSGVDTLAVGTFNDTIDFTNTTSGDGNTTRDVSINVPESIVQPTTGFSSSGKEQGPFSPSVKFYDLINPDGIDSMDYEIRWVADWFIVEDTGDGTGPPPTVEEAKLIQGTLGPAETRNFGVSLTPAADDLNTLRYEDVIRFTNLTNNNGNTGRLVTLDVAAPDLLVSPRAGFESVGGIGGPFTPSEQIYTLTNTSASDLDYDVTAPADTWVEVSGDDFGTLAPSGVGMGTIGPLETTTVTVSMDNAGATALLASINTAAVEFDNTTTVEATNSRSIMLTVASMIVEPLTALEAVGAPSSQLDVTTKEYVVTNTSDDPLDFKVKPAGGRNFGVETVHATQAAADNIGWSTKVTLDRDAVVQSITAYVGGGIGNARYAIHKDSGDKPGELLAETTLFTTAVSFDWVTADLQFPTPTKAGTYWLTIGFDTAAQRFVWSDLGVGMSSRGDDNAVGALGFIAFWTEDSTSTREISIFSSYTEAPFLEVFEFGQSGVIGASQQGSVQDQQIASPFVLDRPAILRGIRAHIMGGNSIRYAIYTDNAGEPDELLAETKSFGTGSSTIFRFRSIGRQTPLSKAFIPLEAGTYWLALAFATNSPDYFYDAGGEIRTKNNDAVTNGFLSPWGGGGSSLTRTLSIAGEVATGAWPGIRIVTPSSTPVPTTAPAGTTGPPETPLGFTDLLVEQTLGIGESVTVEIELVGDTFPARRDPYLDATRFINITDGSGNTDRDITIRAVSMTVTPEGAFAAATTGGTPPVPDTKVYTITNDGNQDLDYLVTSNVSWATLDDGVTNGESSLTGTIVPSDSIDITVTINIAGLDVGEHTASVAFTNMTIDDGSGNTSRQVLVDISADMEVTAGETNFTGFEGGPSSIVGDSTYTITNTSAQPIDYRVRHVADWFEIDDGGPEVPFTTVPASTEPPAEGFFVEGTLAAFPGPGNTVVITVSDNAETAALPLNSLITDDLLFENLTTGVGNTGRFISVTIAPSLIVEPGEPLQSTGPIGGPVFTPQSKEYAITNIRTFPVEFTVTKTESWVALDQFAPTTVPPTSFPPFTTAPDGSITGILEPGESRIIVVSIDSDADALLVDTHIDFVEFIASADTGVAAARGIVLEVISI